MAVNINPIIIAVVPILAIRDLFDDDTNQVTAYVTFERGGKLHAKFTFELGSEENCNALQKQKKIKSLDIQFVK